MNIESCQLKTACKSSGFQRFKQYLTGGCLSSSASSEPRESRDSASSTDNCYNWNFDDDELTKMWDKLHDYDGIHYATQVIKDYDDESHAYTWELRTHLEGWIKMNSIFPIEHEVNCGSKCRECGEMSCTECLGDCAWIDDHDEWMFFCKTCYQKKKETT